MEIYKKKLIIFMPSMEGGGVEKNLILISNYLSKNINNIKLITFNNKFNSFFDKRIKIINSNFNYNKKYSKYFKYAICLILLIKEILKNKSSLVFSFQANIYCCILCFFFNFNLIVRSNTSPSGWNKNFFKKLIFKMFIKKAKSIVVNSIDFKKEMDKIFKINSKFIYNPLNTDEIIRLSTKKISNNLYTKNSIKIINIARFTDQKDHITLLKAFNDARQQNINCELLILGYGTNEKKIKEYITEKKLSKYIRIIKFNKNPYKYLANANLLVLTSLYEGLPNVLLEAMTLKKLVISTNCPTGPAEILKNGKYGVLFKINDYKKLSKIIVNYSKNKKKYLIMANQAHKSLRRFDFEKNCNKYLKLILKYS
jgi:glycosyltransferase involved in cell wall biosynthesis